MAEGPLRPPPPAGLCSQAPTRGQLAFHFHITLEPRRDPAAAGLLTPPMDSHAGRAGQPHLAAGQGLGQLHASASALRSAQLCQLEDTGPALPTTPRASGGRACLRRCIQGPSTLQMLAKASTSHPVWAKGPPPPGDPSDARGRLPCHTGRSLRPCPALNGDRGTAPRPRSRDRGQGP